MAQPMVVVAGAVVAVVGVVWTLQGFGVIEGSAMSDTTTWSIIGPLVLLAGVALAVLGARRRKP